MAESEAERKQYHNVIFTPEGKPIVQNLKPWESQADFDIALASKEQLPFLEGDHFAVRKRERGEVSYEWSAYE